MKLNPQNARSFALCRSALLSVTQFQKLRDFPHHGSLDRLEHCLLVAKTSLWLSQLLRCPVQRESLLLGAALHDFFFYNWYDRTQRPPHHSLQHPAIALENALRCFPLTAKEQNMILSHMWPLSAVRPRSREAMLLCLADKLCCLWELLLALRFWQQKRPCSRKSRRAPSPEAEPAGSASYSRKNPITSIRQKPASSA